VESAVRDDDNRYVKKFGSYYFQNGRGLIRFMTDEVAIGFFYSVAEDGSDEVVIVRHGQPSAVDAWKETIKRLPPILGEPMMVSSNKWDPDQLNFFLGCPGALAQFLREQGLLPARPALEP
jgi:hypothetical protein